MRHRFPHTFETIDRPDGSQDMGRVGPLFPACSQETSLLTPRQHAVEHLVAGIGGNNPRAKRAEDGVVKAWISSLQAERILPINPPADRISGRAIGQAIQALENQDQ
jgi:hypothetical protein